MCKKQKYKLVLALGIGVAKIFKRGGGANHKLHAMTSSEIFEKRRFLWDKDIVE